MNKPEPQLRVGVRPLSLHDASSLLALVQENRSYLLESFPEIAGTNSVPELEEYLLKRWLQNTDPTIFCHSFMISEEATIVGMIGVVIQRATKWANFEYWVTKSRNGRGIAQRAVRIVCEWSFTNSDIDCLIIRATPANRASISVAENLGFSFIGNITSQLTSESPPIVFRCFQLGRESLGTDATK